MKTRPLKIFFAGIDGSGKTTYLDLLISRFGKRYTILKIGPSGPHLFCDGAKKRIFNNPLYKSPGNANAPNRRRHGHALFLILRYLSNHFITQWVRYRAKIDIIMHESDTLIHPSVYITHYAPWTRRVPGRLRFAIVHRFFGPRNNFTIFYLETTPETAMERIRKRNNILQHHENVHDLQRLKADLDKMVSIAAAKGVAIIKIATDNRSYDEVCQEMVTVLTTKFSLTV